VIRATVWGKHPTYLFYIPFILSSVFQPRAGNLITQSCLAHMEGVLLAKRHNATNKDLAVGNEHFKKEIKALTDRQMLPAKTLIPSHGEIREG
jgi:hypothetical protein